MPGKIITFYSYKGGAGRSMSLANVAWILASNGKRVLTVDWDLEAPGLHRYFRPFLLDQELTSSEGILDLVLDYAVEAITPAGSDKERSKDWYLPFANILRYAVTLKWTFPTPGRLDFIPAGQQTPSYASRVNSFDWRNFYDRLGGSAFLEAIKERMRDEYDYILIDSRTGVSDTSGICTIQMPDILVVCFTLNNQSIDGASSVTRAVSEQRSKDGVSIYPVPMRIDNAEKGKLDLRREYARIVFGMLPAHLTNEEREQYLKQVEYPYIPYYAYEEILATFGDSHGKLNTVLAATERLTSYITDGEVSEWVPPTDAERKEILSYYEDAGSYEGSSLGVNGNKAEAVQIRDNKNRRTWHRSTSFWMTVAGVMFVGLILLVPYITWSQFKTFFTGPGTPTPTPTSVLTSVSLMPLKPSSSGPDTPTPTPVTLPTGLVGELEQIELVENPDGSIQAFIRLSIKNGGPPSIVYNYSLQIADARSTIDLKLPPDKLTKSFTLSAGGGTIQPQDSLMSRTDQAVVLGTGAQVDGWLWFTAQMPELTLSFLRQPGIKYVVLFNDAAGKTYEAGYEIR